VTVLMDLADREQGGRSALVGNTRSFKLLVRKNLVDVTGFEPATSCLQKQTLKLDGAKLDEKEEEEQKGPTNSDHSD